MKPALKRASSWAAFLGLIGFVVLYAAGAFRSGRIEPGCSQEPPASPPPRTTAKAERTEIDVFEEAVGTVRSRTRVVVASQIPARIVAVGPRVGDTVRAGEMVVRLDDRELAAALAGAKDALAAAQAARRQAEQARLQGDARLQLAQSRFDRVKGFLDRGAATAEQHESAQFDLAQASAGVADAEAAITAADARIAQAQQIVAGSEVALGHTSIAAPIDGIVAERSVEPGDLAWPGRPLLVVHDPSALRLEAVVREGLIERIAAGSELDVEIPAAGLRTRGRVAEIVPAADPRTRTFEVRIAFPATARALPGMFGRLRIGVGRREVVRIPAAAVTRVGQLETVLAEDGARWTRRLVSTGADLGGGAVEILAGLAGGESVGLPEGAGR